MKQAVRLFFWAGIILAATSSGELRGQAPAATARPALPPLTYLRLDGPAGTKFTFYRGSRGISFDAPCTIGVRPGYAYLFALSLPPQEGAGERSAITLFPVLEVRGSVYLDVKLRNADFPAAINFTQEDTARAVSGSLLTKIVVLERTETALPFTRTPEQPLEMQLPANRSAWHEAQERGAPLAVLYLGQRQRSAEELAAAAIPGTLLLPGEKVLPMPRIGPWVPWQCYPVNTIFPQPGWPKGDPLHGSVSPAEFLLLRQGDDLGVRAGYNAEGQLKGLEPSDTVAEFNDSRGKRRIVPSNRLCLFVPRFLIIKGETTVGSQSASIGPGDTRSTQTNLTYQMNQPLASHQQQTMVESTHAKQRPSGTTMELGTAVTGRVNGLKFISTKLETSNVAGSQPPPESAAPPERPLRLVKSGDKCGGLPGEVITFTIRFINEGGQPISNIVVSENLSARLDYVSGSAQTDREATFTFQPNDAGSAILRWEFPGSVLPGDSGIVTFKVRVR